jgi:hypothetical protein
MPTHHVLKGVLENAPAVTYGGAAATLTLWGLHISDIAALMAAFASLAGVGLQFYVAMHRIRRLEKGLEANNIVTEAQADQARALTEKLETK